MGRANRKTVRQFPSPLSSGKTRSSRILTPWNPDNVQSSYKNLPQGPPLVEDEEENSDAILLADLAPGQKGQDLRGEEYQLIGSEGNPRLHPDGKLVPEFLRVRHGQNFFLVPGKSPLTLLRDSVAYPRFADQLLAAYALQTGYPASTEGGLWRMRREGLWDMRVEDDNETYIQIGPWVLIERGQKGREVLEYPDSSAARNTIEHVAESLEAAPAIDAFLASYELGQLAPEEDATDRCRRITRLALLGLRDSEQTQKELLQRSGQTSDPGAKVMLQVLAESLGRGPFPDRQDPDFLRRVGPVWQMTSRLQLP